MLKNRTKHKDLCFRKLIIIRKLVGKKAIGKKKRRKMDVTHNMNICKKIEENSNMKNILKKKKIRILHS
jgi:hypothetical protein